MQTDVLKNKLFKFIKFVYENDASQGDAMLLYATNNIIAQQPFFIARHSSNIDEFVRTTIDWLIGVDKDLSMLKRLATYNINVANFRLVPSDYAQIIAARISSREGVRDITTARTTSGEGMRGGSIINLESLEGLGGLFYTPKETKTETKTITKPSVAAAKQANTTTIAIVLVSVLFVGLLIYFLTKK